MSEDASSSEPISAQSVFPTSADAFQQAFAGYLARTIGVDQLRRVVARCVLDTRSLARVIGSSFAAAVAARCLSPAHYRLLSADLATVADEAARSAMPSRGSPARQGPLRVLRHRFELQERIATGGIGVLYRAFDRRLREAGNPHYAVAIKMLNQEYRGCPDALRSLQSEARNTRQLSHPNIRTVYGLDRCSSDFFITMEWLEGESLATRLDRTGSRAIPAPAAYRILRGVGAALTHAHGHGIVHGDVKPGNVFITVAGTVKLLDFGQVQAVDAIRRPAGKLAISPGYASCELYEGACPEVGDDIFALAVMAYRVLAGARPFGRYTPLKAEWAGIRALRPASLDARQWHVLQAGLAWRRQQRPASVSEFIDGLLPQPALRCHRRKDSVHAAA